MNNISFWIFQWYYYTHQSFVINAVHSYHLLSHCEGERLGVHIVYLSELISSLALSVSNPKLDHQYVR